MNVDTSSPSSPRDITIGKQMPVDIPEHELTPKSTSSAAENDESSFKEASGDVMKSTDEKDLQLPSTVETTKADLSSSEKEISKTENMNVDEPIDDEDHDLSALVGKEDLKENENQDSIVDEEKPVCNNVTLTINKREKNPSKNSLDSEKTSIATIPDTLLSPPKSETQTDETNTASSSTSNSTSPASDTQMSPSQNALVETIDDTSPPPEPPNTRERRSAKLITNGTIPKSGKPLVADINKILSKSASRSPRIRKQKSTLVTTMYESEISDKKGGIKLCIKKSDTNQESPKLNNSFSGTTSSSSKLHRKRSRKSKSRPQLDSDDSECEPKKKPAERQKKQISFSSSAVEKDKDARPVVDQGDWGSKLPEEVLFKIFHMVVDRDGCLPTLFRLGRVCSLWRRVSLFPTLWKSLDLSTWIKEKYRTELKLKWFVDNRCRNCTELNVANWKVSDISCFLTKLASGCPNLQGITLAGWKSFNCDHLTFLVDNLHKLERIDLSSVNVEMNASRSAVGLVSICNALQTMNGRLTHLNLAHNRLAGIPQIVTVLATHCPNLTLLDLSNVTTQATSHGILHIEKLQHGCQKLKVLRVTNSHITLSTATLQEQMDSPGFPDLEELSVAALTHESRIICDEHLQRILKTSSKLKLLDVRGCMRLTHESLIRLPAWDIKHLFLSGCSITRDVGSGLELIASKWAHSLIELDLAWANVQQPLDNALKALAEKGAESPLAHLNLCGSSVSDEAVKEILANCPQMSSINLASCRGLPRGVKRLMQGSQLQELRDVLKVQMKVKLPSENDKTNDNNDGNDNGKE